MANFNGWRQAMAVAFVLVSAAAADGAGCPASVPATFASGSPPNEPSVCFVLIPDASIASGSSPSQMCHALGGPAALGSIHSASENAFLQGLGSSFSAIELGAFSSTVLAPGTMTPSYQWVWFDGTATNYNDFANGVPPGPGYIYMSVPNGGVWLVSRNRPTVHLCRITAAALPPTTTTTTTAMPTTTGVAPTSNASYTTTAAPSTPSATNATTANATTVNTTTTYDNNTTMMTPTSFFNTTTAPSATNETANVTTAAVIPSTAPMTPAPTTYDYEDCAILRTMAPPNRSVVVASFSFNTTGVSALHATLIPLVNATSRSLRRHLAALRVAVTPSSSSCPATTASAWLTMVCDDVFVCGLAQQPSWFSSAVTSNYTLCVAPSAASIDAARRATTYCNATDVASSWFVSNNNTSPEKGLDGGCRSTG